MKRCPQCNERFQEDYFFCLADGTPLVSDGADEPTVVRPVPTVAPSPRRGLGGVSPVFAYLAVGLLALVAGGAAVLWMGADSYILQGDRTEAANASSPGSNQNKERAAAATTPQKANSQSANFESETAKPTPTAAPKKAEAVTETPEEEERAVLQKYPTVRIKFGRGRVQETVAGRIGTERDYVLYTLAGQSLSASVGSGKGCVTFENGSATTSYTTSNGDQNLRLVNTCPTPATFSLTVRVR